MWQIFRSRNREASSWGWMGRQAAGRWLIVHGLSIFHSAFSSLFGSPISLLPLTSLSCIDRHKCGSAVGVKSIEDFWFIDDEVLLVPYKYDLTPPSSNSLSKTNLSSMQNRLTFYALHPSFPPSLGFCCQDCLFPITPGFWRLCVPLTLLAVWKVYGPLLRRMFSNADGIHHRKQLFWNEAI